MAGAKPLYLTLNAFIEEGLEIEVLDRIVASLAAAARADTNPDKVDLTVGIYMDEEARAKFESDYRATGKRFDVGKSCVRFRKLDDLPLPVIAEAIAGNADRFDAMADIPIHAFPGGTLLRYPGMVLGMMYYSMIDRF